MKDYEKLLQYSLSLLAKKRYTGQEIGKKMNAYLRREDMDDDGLVNSVVERLLELKYIDDLQYAKDYVSGRVRFRPRGKFLLKKELRQKGIPKEMIEQAMENEDIDEEKMAIESLVKKQKIWAGLPFKKQKEKAFRFLAGKGFSPDAIYKAVESLYSSSRE